MYVGPCLTMKFVLCDVNPADAVVVASTSTNRKFYIVHRYCGHKSTDEYAWCSDKPKHIVCSKVWSLFRSICQKYCLPNRASTLPRENCLLIKMRNVNLLFYILS